MKRNKILLILVLLVLSNFVFAEEGIVKRGAYKGLSYEVVDVTNDTVPNIYDCFNNITNITENCSGKDIVVTSKHMEIKQDKYSVNVEKLIPYEKINFTEWENTEYVNRTELIIEKAETKTYTVTKKPQEEEYNYIIVIFIILIIFIVSFKISKYFKKVEEKTAEQQVKELLDAGMDEEYCVKVYEQLKDKK